MLIPQQLLRCVAFLGQETSTDSQVRGTAFFVKVTLEEAPDRQYVYLVTASHCIRDVETGQPRRNLFLRLNTPDGHGTYRVELPDGDKWELHPNDDDQRVDIAAIWFPYAPDIVEAGYGWINPTMFFDEAVIGDNPIEGVGLGDEVFAMGLFPIHSGESRNETIVRLGSLAMVPSEPVVTNEAFGEMDLYLVELRSVGGMSGSPVFIRLRSHLLAPKYQIALLGVLLGHYPERSVDIGGHTMNMGIGMVAPARLLSDILSKGAMVEDRKVGAEAARALGPQAEMDRDQTDEEDTITRERFLHDLRKVTRKPE